MKVPQCAVCGHGVEEFMTFRDERRRVEVYIARCHGAEQVVELPDELLMLQTNISMGMAFAVPRLKE